MASIASNEIFSQLPDDILPQILCSLTLKQRATTSLVSRQWHSMITSLHDGKFVQTNITTNRYFCQYNLPFCTNFSTLHPVIIKLAPDNTTLTELYMFVPASSPFLQIPPAIFESRLLTVLHLKYCRIDDKNFEVFPSLKEICFDRVAICRTTFSNFIKKCPSIVELTLIRCCYLYFISVPHLNQLKKVHVNYGTRYIQTIEIKARNLREFHLFTSSSSLEVDLRSCTKLQVLKIDSEYIPIGFPEDISSKFPRLKSLSLRLCKKLKKLQLLSPELENLTVSDMVDLEDATIVTPNLRSFKLINMGKIPISSPVVGSRLIEVEIGFKYVPALQHLRTYAENLGENITLSFDTTQFKEVIPHSGNLQSNVIEPLCINHINLELLVLQVQTYESLIDELFSYFRPRTLLVRVDPDALNCNFIQVLFDELKGQKRNCTKRYKCSNYKCWRYALKSFEILESTTTTKQGAHQIRLEFQWHLP